ncbi:hypothetical protein DV735_g36, partial [Chaetothyriales sp. CBS 134920]
MRSQPPPAPEDFSLTRLQSLFVDNILPRLPTSLQMAFDSLGPLIQSGDIVSLAAFLLAVYLTLRIADCVCRSVFSWVLFLVKVALVLMTIQAVLYAQRYGWEKTLDHAVWLVGMAWRVLEETFHQVSSSTSSSSSSSTTRGKGGDRWNLNGGRQQVPVAKRQGRL